MTTRGEFCYERTCDAWSRRCERCGYLPIQPSRSLSTVERKDGGVKVVLRNVNGWLGTYRYRETQR